MNKNNGLEWDQIFIL